MQYTHYCPKCRSKIDAGTSLCANCGTQLNWYEFKPPDYSTQLPQYQQQHVNDEEQYDRQLPKKRGMTLRLIVLLCILGFIIFGGITWSLSKGGSTTFSITPFSGAIIITASELYAQWDANQEAAAAKYMDKLIEVSGIIDDMGVYSGNMPFVVLTGGYELFGVQCFLSAKDEPKLARLVNGQSLTIQGICHGYRYNVILDNCSIK